jgi:hypothetical protein
MFVSDSRVVSKLPSLEKTSKMSPCPSLTVLSSSSKLPKRLPVRAFLPWSLKNVSPQKHFEVSLLADMGMEEGEGDNTLKSLVQTTL